MAALTPATDAVRVALPKLKVAYRRPYGMFVVRDDDMHMSEAELQEIVRRCEQASPQPSTPSAPSGDSRD